jgi:hypothetical protein
MFARSIDARSSTVAAAMIGIVIAACADATTPTAVAHAHPEAAAGASTDLSSGEPNAAAGETRAIIGAWLDGEPVELRYTRSYHCEEPPESIASTGCELGAPPEDFPRGGRIPIIYAIAPAGFVPSDASTLHCVGCANHPPMIDVTRLNIPGLSIATRPPHSHIITSRQAGWHRTINIRVLSPSMWNQIVASPSLATVQQLRAANPTLISADIPTNIFFFFQVRGPSEAP